MQPEAKACYIAHFDPKHVLTVNCAALAPERGLRAFYASQELKPPPVQGELLEPGDVVAAGSSTGGRSGFRDVDGSKHARCLSVTLARSSGEVV